MTIGQTAMVLAAGLGTRMRPLSLKSPKPLIDVAGKPLIAYSFDHLRAAGVSTVVVNAHYLPQQIVDWCAKQHTPRIFISDETDAILDTGGGIARALPLLGSDPFFVLNSDSFWVDDGKSALDRLRNSWTDAMDCLLLLCDPIATTGYEGRGDFIRDPEGHLTRRPKNGENALAYIGGYLVHPRLFSDAPQGKFSMNLLWDRAISNKRLFGLVHHGHWLHVGTPESILEAEQFLKLD